MFRIFKSYLKWKLSSLIKDRLIHYNNAKYNHVQRQNEWECKVHDGKCLSKTQFEKQQQEQINWSNNQYRMCIHKIEAISEVLEIVENL